MFERVVVLGAGAAGVAAVWAAAQRGAEIRLFDGGVGASCLGGGAVDDRPWEEVARAVEVLEQPLLAGALPAPVTAFVEQLSIWRLPATNEPLARLATEAGRVRVARGHDRALLDLSRLPDGARVLLPRVARAEWDADALARGLSADAYAQSRRMRFEAVDAKVLKLVGDDRISSLELASRHDDADRRGWLAERMREMLVRAGDADALLMGPWLGADRPVAAELSERIGLAAGEVVGGVGSASGMRFESARLRLLSSFGIELEPLHALAIAGDDGQWQVTLESGEPAACDAVVLAIGGVASGGVVYEPPEQRAGQDLAAAGGAAFRASLDAPVALAAQGRPIEVVGSMHGPPLDEIAWPVDADPGYLESVGIACSGVEAGPRIFVAGDAMADRPRTLLQAVYSGALAGAAAAGEPGAIRAG